MFSKACEYGIKAVIYIATQSMEGRKVKMGDIVAHSGSPEAFTGKILSLLSRHNIVISQTGPYGGFSVATENMRNIKLSQIVYAIDGDAVYSECALGLKECSHTHPCPMHHKFVKVRNELKKVLETTSLHDLAIGLKEGKTLLIR